MDVIYSKEVIRGLYEYLDTLSNSYPISKKRAVEKLLKMNSALLSIGENPNAYPICVHKDLGQRLNKNGEPKDKCLHRFNYQDESGFQWAFAYRVAENKGKVFVTKMMPASLVKEDKSSALQGILNLMERVMNIRR